MEKAFIGLGSNLEKPIEQLKSAIKQLKTTESIDSVRISHFYKSKPVGPQEQPDFINAVAELNTTLTAEQLLDELQKIENNHGRVRLQHWGPRTLDLDILLFGDNIINSARLTIPHKEMGERNFVLYPLNDLVADNFEIPDSGNLKQLLALCSSNGLERLSTK